jgi:hypothetical protein
MSNQVQLSIVAPGLDDEEIATLSRELETWIDAAAAGCEAKPWTEPAPAGAKGAMGANNKGVLEIIGKIGVSFLDHGAIGSLASCLSVFIKERRPDIQISVKAPSGGSFEFKAGALGPKEIDDIVSRLGAMIAPAARAST